MHQHSHIKTYGAFLTPKINSKHRVSFEFSSSFFIEGATYEIYSKETRRKLDASSKFKGLEMHQKLKQQLGFYSFFHLS